MHSYAGVRVSTSLVFYVMICRLVRLFVVFRLCCFAIISVSLKFMLPWLRYLKVALVYSAFFHIYICFK